MSKSYSPTQTRGKTNPPAWHNMRGTFSVASIVTDDTEFGPGLMRPAGEGLVYYTHRRRNGWHTVTIQAKRIRRIAEKKEVI